jgi:hypothetical protein
MISLAGQLPNSQLDSTINLDSIHCFQVPQLYHFLKSSRIITLYKAAGAFAGLESWMTAAEKADSWDSFDIALQMSKLKISTLYGVRTCSTQQRATAPLRLTFANTGSFIR